MFGKCDGFRGKYVRFENGKMTEQKWKISSKKNWIFVGKKSIFCEHQVDLWMKAVDLLWKYRWEFTSKMRYTFRLNRNFQIDSYRFVLLLYANRICILHEKYSIYFLFSIPQPHMLTYVRLIKSIIDLT